MNTLQELTEILSRNKIKRIEIIGNPSDRGTKMMQFYDAIREGKVASDDEALVFLYGEAGNKNAYYKLKHSLKNRLLNTLFFIDAKDKKYSDVKKAYLSCQKEVRIFEILMLKGAKRTAVGIGKKLLEKAKFYEFTEINITVLKALRQHHATMTGNRIQFKNFDSLLLIYQDLNFAETLAQGKYLDIMSYYVNDKSTKEFIYDLASGYSEEIKRLNPKIESSNFFFYSTMVEITKYMSINDYRTTAIICKKSLKELEAFPYKNVIGILLISYQLIASCTQLKRYEESKECIDKCLSILEEGVFNWFKLHELHLSLCLHTQQYDTAWAIYKKMTSHPRFKKLFPNVREVWKIYEAWLRFLIEAGKIELSCEERKGLPTFRLYRFLNEVPIYSKDKRGLNVPILVIQTLLMLQQNNYDGIFERIEAIGKYKDRYLKRGHNYRSNCFIRMLAELPKAGYLKSKALRKTDRYFRLMQSEPIIITDQNHDLEIAPYEDSWKFMTGYLDEDVH